jgi:hypothetical protein
MVDLLNDARRLAAELYWLSAGILVSDALLSATGASAPPVIQQRH